MPEWTVRVVHYKDWSGQGEPPVSHFLCWARDAATAEAQTACMMYDGRRLVPEGAIITAFPRFL